MADPTPYVPGFDYSDYEQSNPTLPKPGGQLDNDFANIKLTTDETIAALEDIRRSDGALNNGIVTFDSLSTDLKVLMGGSDDLEIVADNIASVITVADNIAGVNTVATNIVAVDTVADNIAAITAVASNTVNVNAVAANMTSVTTVAANLTDVTNYFDRELGPKTADPTTRNDGSALQVDDRYFNTTDNSYRIYNGATWQPTAIVGADVGSANVFTAQQTIRTAGTPQLVLERTASALNATLQAMTTGGSIHFGNADGSSFAVRDVADINSDPWLRVSATAITAGAGVVFTGDGSGLTNLSNVVPPTRSLTAGNGLTGGGDLSANRSFAVGGGDGISVTADAVAVDSTVVRTARTLTAGNGLTGGGDLSANRSFAVGAGDGISVNATQVNVDGTVVRWGRTIATGAGLIGGGNLTADRTIALDIYTGGAADNTVYPIGSYLAVHDASGQELNLSATLYLSTDGTNYVTFSSGAGELTIAGTWQNRGGGTAAAGGIMLFQRVA